MTKCPAWDSERAELIKEFGSDLDLVDIIREIAKDKDKWSCFSNFCTKVMSQKEKAERIKQAREEGTRRR
jgi:hypothetical protein